MSTPHADPGYADWKKAKLERLLGVGRDSQRREGADRRRAEQLDDLIAELRLARCAIGDAAYAEADSRTRDTAWNKVIAEEYRIEAQGYVESAAEMFAGLGVRVEGESNG